MGKKIIGILFFITVVSSLAVGTTERVWAQETEKLTSAKGEDGWRFLIAPFKFNAWIHGPYLGVGFEF